MGNISFSVPLIPQGDSPICWLACVAMIKSFKTHRTRSVSEFASGFDPGSSCISGTKGSNDKQLAKLGFTVEGAYMSIGASYIEGTLRRHGPFIMFFYMANFPFTGAECANMNGKPDDAHAVVVTGVNTATGKVRILNPWGTDTPPADIDTIIELMQDFSDKGFNPVAYMK
jgi:hypothetical protein